MEILTGEQMRRVDRRAIEILGIASLLLMESAGRGVAEALLEDYPHAASHGILVLCGKGNNGGDGLVAARHLARMGATPRVVLLGARDQLQGDAAVNLRAAVGSGLVVEEVTDSAGWSNYRRLLDRPIVVMDAMLGTGIRGGARGLLAEVIHDLNDSATDVTSIDLPSGLDADSHRVDGPAVGADRTYTLCRPKLPLALEPGALHAGRWRVIPIGIPDDAVAAEEPELEWLDADAVRGLLPPRAPQDHKGKFGHLLVVAGSLGKVGAAVLTARGALRAGVGLVTVATASSVQPVVAAGQAEMMTEPLAETGPGVLSGDATRRLLQLLEERDALAIGPGLGTAPETREAVLAVLRDRAMPVVVDADGLNALAEGGTPDREALRSPAWPLLLTPHPGEAARMLGSSAADVQEDRLGSARRLAERTGAVVVLKGHRTLVASPGGRVAFNSTGNPGMATGGTGDVLTGIIGALLARGLSAETAARLGVFVHGDAGDRAAAARGPEGMIPADLLDSLPDALAVLSSEGEAKPW